MKADKTRITHQREVILEKLRSVKTHPSADEIYDMVRQKLPRISLATVYRNLEFLSVQGLVQKIEVGGRQKRFDGNPEQHYHIRCMQCGKVDDVELEQLEDLEKGICRTCGYKVLGHRIEFIGLCPACRLKSQ